MSLRAGRRWLTAKASYGARAMAPIVPRWAIDVAEWWMRRTGPTWPVLARIVRENMRSAGVYDRDVFRDYFAQVALHLSNAMRIFRLARRDGAVAGLAREHVDVDGSVSHIHQALERGRGAIVVPAHVCDYVLTLARLNQEVPVRVYLRWSDDEHNREMKRNWCEATGLGVILEPASAADPASRAAACVEALRGGTVLVMTPDIAQKSNKGVAVQLLGREVYLPTGPASIAMLAEAPLVPVFGRLVRGAPHLARGVRAHGSCSPPTSRLGAFEKHVIYANEPIFVEALSRAEGGRRTAIRRAMQSWADRFEAFLRECPQAWFLWGDSRWRRVFLADPRYCDAQGSSTSEQDP
ncbi:MAG: hypothetical protein JXQ75_23345 [Phycisphaerae bacterium]|nr:hypothetical protein [Phycisphaerae bacterium]